MKHRHACWALLLLAVPAIGRAQGDSTTNEARLDSLYAPLVYLMHQDERGIYASLSVGGKRDFLRRFWARRAPTPGTPKNEAQEAYNARIAAVNRKFREGGATEVPGWRTDRGRIYLEYGPPDIVLSRRGPGPTLSFEVWKYTRAKLRKYCFVDLTGFGNYVLVYSNDVHEPTRPGWRDLLGDEAYWDALNF